MMAFLINKGLSFEDDFILDNLDGLLQMISEEFMEDGLPEIETLNTSEEQILGIINLLITLGKGLNEAGDDH